MQIPVIAHYDLDSFFVSVECLKNSVLKGKALIVGGGDRGVVAACSYEARKFGVRSAMPIKTAKRLCPEVTIVRGNMQDYSKYSRIVTNVIADQVPLFEKASIDEFYIDLTGMEKFFGISKYAQQLKQKIHQETGLTITYAVASNKLVSKVATDEVKPNGQIEVPFGAEKEFLAPLAVEKLPMVGRKTTELLNKSGIFTIRDLSSTPESVLIKLMGKNGSELLRRANGIDDSPVVPYHEQKSISTEQTFETDITDTDTLQAFLLRMTEKVAYELRQENKLAGCVAIKIRYSDFHTETHQTVISYTAADHTFIKTVKDLFDRSYTHKPVRLIGVRLTSLIQGSYQVNLFEDTIEMVQLYQHIDDIKSKFGEHMLRRAGGKKSKK